MNSKYCFAACLSVLLTGSHLFAARWIGSQSGKGAPDINNIASGCANPATSTYLSFNNVRALIHTGGDMWWDLLGNPQYEIPKNSGAHSLFLGDLWLGGTDVNEQLRIAAQRYRDKGVDFYTGPLSKNTAEITPNECTKWDRHFVVSRKEVDEFRAWSQKPDDYPNYVIPLSITEWPAHGDITQGQDYYMAPFFDNDGDESYEPLKGDYPWYDLDPATVCNRSRDREPKLYGDYTLWWVFNDKGNVHKETNADAIGMEIKTQAFAFATQDEINNMTFTNYIITNRSTYSLINTYFGTNFDPDIGCAFDDYVGCDVVRGLGYAYNGDAIDGSPCDVAPPGDYGDKTPAVGIDFFEGPYQDPDNTDNPRLQTITGLSFVGTGLNDLIAGGTYTGNGDATILIRITDVIMQRDSFQWAKVTGSFTDTASIVQQFCPAGNLNCLSWSKWDSVARGKEGGSSYPASQLIIDGITVSFINSKNHTAGSLWLIRASATPVTMCDPSINGLNFGDGVVDNERWGMRRFLYYNNCGGGPTCDPSNGLEYYRLLQGVWKDGQKMVYGGNGHPSGCSGMPCIPSDFMFPGDPSTDPCGWGQKDGNGGIPVDLSGTPWNEVIAGNAPGDRRFVHSAGPFRLDPGSVNDITTGVVWMRADDGNPLSSVELVRLADDKAQALFDNCFKLLNGPDAPCVDIQELDKELIVSLSYPSTSNNYLENYVETDPTIPRGQNYDSLFIFQGYQIYQLKDSTVSVDELTNTERSRLVAQCDIKDNITKIINYEYDDEMGVDVPVLMVNGSNSGIRHTFQVTDDLFSTTADKKLVNFKKYYFMAIAYAYNNYDSYSPSTGDITGQRKPFLRGRKNCVGGSIAPATGIPHKPTPEAGGTEPVAKYGDAPQITRYEGCGNGGLDIDLDPAVESEILANGKATTLKYVKGKGPVDIKIIDPLNVKPGSFTLTFLPDSFSWDAYFNISAVKTFGYTAPPSAISGKTYFLVQDNKDDSVAYFLKPGDKIYASGTGKYDGTYTVYKINGKEVYVSERILNDTTASTTFTTNGVLYRKQKWIMKDAAGNTVATSEKAINVRNEQLIPEYGISITIEQSVDPGPVMAYTFAPVGSASDKVDVKISDVSRDPNNGFITGDITFTNNNKPWLYFIPDGDGCNALNWIRAGTRKDDNTPTCNDYGITSAYFTSYDSTEAYEEAAGSTWAPFALASQDSLGPVPKYAHSAEHTLNRIMSVDLVITSDESKWSRAPVFEMEDVQSFSEGQVPKFALRDDYSLDKNGNPSADTSGSTNPDAPNYIGGKGMSWFPGYAINVETGERLNIIFGENSRLKTDLHGDDMKWNPSKSISSPTGEFALQGGFCELGAQPGCPYWAGGMHFIYIVGNDIDGSGIGTAYDNGEWIYNTLKGKNPTANALDYYKVLKNIMWTGLPFVGSDYVFDDPHNIPTDVRVRLRVSKPYSRFASGDPISATAGASSTLEAGKYYYVVKGHAKHNGKQYGTGSVFKAENSILELDTWFDSKDKNLGLVTVVLTQNEGNPLFGFSLDEFVPRTGDNEVAKDALDMIGVVPNPYYGMSAYETSPVDNRVKIINLPKRCVISIYNINGTLVRQFDRDDESNTFIDWNLKNAKGVPVASGVYVIHILVPDVGEKIIKWFGVIRPVDLEAF